MKNNKANLGTCTTKIEIVNLSQLRVNEANPRTISKEKFDKLVNSLLVLPKMLNFRPIAIDDLYTILGGNMRYRALVAIENMTTDELAQRLSEQRDYQNKTDAERVALVKYWDSWRENPTAPIVRASELSEQERKEFIIKDNVGYGAWDMDMLANEWDNEDLDAWGLDVWQPLDLNTEENTEENTEGILAARFIVPPYSIIDSRRGYWQTRKKAWRALINDYGESREDLMFDAIEFKYKKIYVASKNARKKLGVSFKEYLDKYVPPEEKAAADESGVLMCGVSLLDPIVAEIVCKWFGVENGKTFDCFAGDTVFGYVSAYLGNEFVGIEIRSEQVQRNIENVKGLSARYICDDGQNVEQYIEAESQDLLFSCPPYFDLECYSDLENDASNQKSYDDFIEILRNAFTASCRCLKDNRFAVIMVGDIRDKRGAYYDFCGDIKRIFKDAGLNFYNELIYIESGANAYLRASKQMRMRKVVKMHQNILVFYKGDPRKIKNYYKEIEYGREDLEFFEMDYGDGSTEATNNGV